jgi:hypothetical protein
MPKLMSAASALGHEKVHALFEAGGPVLVEARHPGGILSPDWFLLDSEDEFNCLVDRLQSDVVLHFNRVWDLTNPIGAVVLRR